jgi:transposase
MPWSRGAVNDRHEMIERHLAGWTKTELAEHFGVSWRCVHKWVERFEDSEGDWEALEEKSRKTYHSPRSTPQAIVDGLLRLALKDKDGRPS